MPAKSGFGAWLWYALFRVLTPFVLVFPIDANLATARWAGRCYARLRTRHRARAVEHIRAAYGHALPPDRAEEVAGRSIEHLAMFAMEALCAPRLITRWTWNRYIRVVNFEPVVRILLSGRGAILITGHFGNWELLGHLFACLGFDMTAVMRPLDNVHLNEYLVRTRATHGLQLLDKKGASAAAADCLQRGGLLGIIADQDAGRKGVFVDFFGRPASSYKMIALLAMETQSPIVVGYARRLGPRFQYEAGLERVIEPQEWRDRPDPLRWITQTWSSAIESIARRDPQQYLWIHRRWKTQPRRARDAEGSGAP